MLLLLWDWIRWEQYNASSLIDKLGRAIFARFWFESLQSVNLERD